MTGRATRERLHERIAQICASAADARSLRQRVLEELARAVSFDAYVWLVTDPVTAVGSAPLADVPCLSELPTLIRLKYLTPLNRWSTLARRDDPVGLMARDTNGDLSRSLVWRELLHAHAISDIASLAFADRFGCWGFLDLWRIGSGRCFDEDDAQLLRELAPRLTRALRESQARTFVAPAVAERRDLGPVVLLLDDALAVRARTPATDRWLEVLLPSPEGRTPIPASVYNVAAQLLATEAGVDPASPLARVHLANGVWVTLRAARLSAETDASMDGIAVTVEEASPRERLDIFARSSGFTPREAELLGCLVRGEDTHEIAERMFVSEHTVQDHLKSMFTKTSDHSRRSVVSRALGTQI